MSLQAHDAEAASGFISWVLTRLLKPQSEADQVEVRSSRSLYEYAETLDEVVGHERTVRLLRAEIQASQREGRPLGHLLLYGPPGCGKTLLCHAAARGAGAGLYPATGPEFASQVDVLQTLDRLTELYQRIGRPVVLLIDEADGLTRAASYALHSLMVSGVVWWRGHELYRGLPVSIFATSNRLSGIPPAMRSRFAQQVYVDFLGEADLAQVVRQAAVRMGAEVTDEAAAWIGRNSGGEGRKALHILRTCLNLGGAVTLEAAKASLELSGLYAGGLSEPQWDYLRFLADAKDGTAGLSGLSAFLAMDQKDVIGAVEPFLIRSRAVEITAKGRRITDRGRALAVGA